MGARFRHPPRGHRLHPHHRAAPRGRLGAIARLIHSSLASLDGYTVDEDGQFDWARPDEEVHSFFNDLERSIGTHLYGRRMYETMAAWETPETIGDEPVIQDYSAVWRDAEKIVFSGTLETVSTARTRIEPEFSPDLIRRLKSEEERDISIGGPTIAEVAIRAGLVDEYHLVLMPVTVGGGTPFFPRGVRVELELLDERRFESGAVHLHYRTRS